MRIARGLLLSCVMLSAGAGCRSTAVAPEAATALQPGSTLRDCPYCPELVVIAPGSFLMGAVPGEEEREGVAEDNRGHAVPQHRVTIGYPLAVARYEVQRGQYARFVAATGHPDPPRCVSNRGVEGRGWRNPGYDQTDDHPVVCVSWDDANAYVRWLSEQTGQRYRLLSEAEWEYAARAGTRSVRYWGDEGELACSYANVGDVSSQADFPQHQFARCNDGYARTAPSGSFKPNAFGLYDMIGNVWEWTADCYHDSYQGAPADGSAWISEDCPRRSFRGGSWDNQLWYERASFRVRFPTQIRVFALGFRVARELAGPGSATTALSPGPTSPAILGAERP